MNNTSKVKKEKMIFYAEAAYVIGIILIALGTAFMKRADFGMSMIVAPAYIIHLKVSETLPWFSFGMSEYLLQAVLLIVLMTVLRKFRIGLTFSFVTAVFYGFLLDLFLIPVSLLPADPIPLRIVYFISGMIFTAAGVAFVFHTYIPPEVYELFVKEISSAFSLRIGTVKTVFDCVCLAAAVVLSFVFFGLWNFTGIGVGTVICAALNGRIISRFSSLLDSLFTFRDAFRFRSQIEK